MTKRFLELILIDAGGGHRSATEALRAALAETHPDWDVTVTDLQEILKSADPLFILTGVPSQNFYNAALKMGLTYGSRPFLRGLQTIIKICASRMEDVLRQHWSSNNGKDVDAVVSLIPNFNAVMFRALHATRPAVPYITIMTDMADSPPHFWQEKQDQHIICGTELAANQAYATGWYRRERIYQTSGMILRPSFYQLSKKSHVKRADIGFSDDRPIALIMFGGYGSSLSETIVEKLNKAELDVQMIVMCGNNKKLLADLKGKKNCHAVAYTENIADYMRISDFMIGKPGPGSISEAWHMGLPVIVESNARTMIQERPNALLVKELGAGIVVKSFSTIDRVVRRLIESDQLEMMRDNVRQMQNKAVFEIPDILSAIMEQPASGGRSGGLRPPRTFARFAKKLRKKKL